MTSRICATLRSTACWSWGARFNLCHASPSNSLYGYFPDDSWEAVRQDEAARVNADFILSGHTHQQFVKPVGRKTFVKPGSLEQQMA